MEQEKVQPCERFIHVMFVCTHKFLHMYSFFRNIVSGLIRPSSGSAAINGLDVVDDFYKLRSKIGFCPQHDVFFD